MAENIFINSRLQAAAVADGAREVHAWVDQLAGILELGVKTDYEVYDLLALCGKLRRVRPEFVRAAGGDAVMAKAEQLIAEQGVDFAKRALRIPNPQAWLEEAGRLEASYTQLIDASERAAFAEQLLDDLDDAELVLAVARRLGQHDRELDSQLDRCTDWLAEHADVFLSVTVYVQGIGLALRPDLEDFDYDLTATALKFADILLATEEAERQLDFADVVPLEPQVVNALYERFRQESERTEASSHQGVESSLPVPGAHQDVRPQGPEADPDMPRRPVESNRSVFLAAKSASADDRNEPKQGAQASRYTLKDEQGRVFELLTDRNARVFVLLPDTMLAAPPKSVLIKDEAFTLTRSDERAFDIELLSEHDLPDFADSESVLQGKWQ